MLRFGGPLIEASQIYPRDELTVRGQARRWIEIGIDRIPSVEGIEQRTNA